MQSSKFFKAEQIGDRITAIMGLGTELCYLVEGEKKALLIDTLSGIGNLKAYCRELTDLELSVVNTHGHVDHCGGNFDFSKCYIHPSDINLLFDHVTIDRRFGYVETMQKQLGLNSVFRKEDLAEPRPLITLPIYDSDIFDLGHREIEVISVPGHSRGSIVLLDRTSRIVFSGDACNVNTLLSLPGSTSVEEYHESLLHFKTFQTEFDVLRGGHGLLAFSKDIIDEAIELCEEILIRKDDAVVMEFLGRSFLYGKAAKQFRRLDGKMANIAYTVDGIRRQSTRRVIC